jgi:hypothetical protein
MLSVHAAVAVAGSVEVAAVAEGSAEAASAMTAMMRTAHAVPVVAVAEVGATITMTAANEGNHVVGAEVAVVAEGLEMTTITMADEDAVVGTATARTTAVAATTTVNVVAAATTTVTTMRHDVGDAASHPVPVAEPHVEPPAVVGIKRRERRQFQSTFSPPRTPFPFFILLKLIAHRVICWLKK